MADITRQTITIANAGKLIVFIGGLTGLFYGIKTEQQSIKDEIRLMINDYKAEDRVLNLKIETNEKRDDRQDNDIKFLTERCQGILPESPRRRNR